MMRAKFAHLWATLELGPSTGLPALDDAAAEEVIGVAASEIPQLNETNDVIADIRESPVVSEHEEDDMLSALNGAIIPRDDLFGDPVLAACMVMDIEEVTVKRFRLKRFTERDPTHTAHIIHHNMIRLMIHKLMLS